MSSFTDSLLAEAAAQATVMPPFQINRLRAAAATDMVYEGLETYDQWKPVLFAVSVSGAIISGAALARRRRTPEAIALYGIGMLVSGLSAWLTRPNWLIPSAPPTVAANSGAPSSMDLLLGRLDARAARNTQQRPGWEAATLTRLASDVGSGTMNPAVAALLTRNTH